MMKATHRAAEQMSTASKVIHADAPPVVHAAESNAMLSACGQLAGGGWDYSICKQ